VRAAVIKKNKQGNQMFIDRNTHAPRNLRMLLVRIDKSQRVNN
jgi:hypothetical protein